MFHKNLFIKSILASFYFILGITIFGFIAYKVFAALSNVNSGDTLSATNRNELITKINTLETNIASLNSIPSGSIVAFNSTTCPTGWSKANGTNGTPDLRGEFIRGWDDGKGTDSGRTIASSQKASLTPAKRTSGISINSIASSDSTQGYAQFGDLITINDGYPAALKISQNANAGSETIYPLIGYGAVGSRPRNIALLYCIKN